MTTLERMNASLVEVKLAGAGDEVGSFSGYGAIFGNTDSYGDVIKQGAFAETLKEWKARGKWPKMLLQHGGWGVSADDMVPVGQWTHMEENSRGLKVEGRLFALNTERGQYIYEGLKAGELDGLSIGYMVREAINGTKPNEPLRTLTNIDLWEVSIVTFPANDKALIGSVKGRMRELERDLRDAGLSRKQAEIAVATLLKLLQRDAGDPDSTPRDEVVPGTEEAEAQAILESLSRYTTLTVREVFRT